MFLPRMQSSPIRTCSRIWQCSQTWLRSPITALAAITAVGWIRAVTAASSQDVPGGVDDRSDRLLRHPEVQRQVEHALDEPVRPGELADRDEPAARRGLLVEGRGVDPADADRALLERVEVRVRRPLALDHQ